MTTPPLDTIREALAALVPSRAGGVQERIAGLAVLGQVRALVDAVCAQAAGELEADAGVSGPENPVSAGGHASAASLLSALWGVSVATAGMFCRVGAATQPRTSLTGEVLPARFEQVGSGVADGSVSVEKAAVIVRELEKAAVACSADALATGEQVLVGFAPGYSVRELRGLAVQVRDRLDQDGIEPREVRQRRRRSLRVTTTEDAMVRIDALLDPESAAPVVTAIDAIVTAGLHRNARVAFRDEHDGPADTDQNTRTVAQLRADALVDLCRHVDNVPYFIPPATVDPYRRPRPGGRVRLPAA